jgi:hypothetical protein
VFLLHVGHEEGLVKPSGCCWWALHTPAAEGYAASYCCYGIAINEGDELREIKCTSDAGECPSRDPSPTVSAVRRPQRKCHMDWHMFPLLAMAAFRNEVATCLKFCR